MPSYLVELYLPRAELLTSATEDARQIERAAEDLRYVRTFFLAADETCIHVFEGASLESLLEASKKAGLEGVRVTEAIESVDAVVRDLDLIREESNR